MAGKEMHHRQPVPFRNSSIGPLSRLISVRMRSVDVLLTRGFAQAESRLRPGIISSLGLIVGNPGISQAGLAERTGTDKSIIVGIVNALEEKGWANRTPSDTDRRRYKLYATAAGEAELERIVAQVAESEARMLARMAPEELDFLGYLLAKMHASCIDAILPADGDAATT